MCAHLDVLHHWPVVVVHHVDLNVNRVTLCGSDPLEVPTILCPLEENRETLLIVERCDGVDEHLATI